MKDFNIKEAMLLYAVTDRSYPGNDNLEDKIIQAIEGGITILQVREKNLPTEEFIKVAGSIKKITDKHQIPLIINDNITVCKEIDADGVHIGQSDCSYMSAREILGKDKIIGVSCTTLEEAKIAEKYGADYLGVGAVFPTSTKLDADYVNYNDLKIICENTSIPVVAIGGINEENIKKLKGTKIDGVAVISAIFYKDNVKEATEFLYNEVLEVVKC